MPVRPLSSGLLRSNMNMRIPRLLEEAEAQKHSGSGESTVTSESRSCPTAAEADGFFDELRQELFCVREWNRKPALTDKEPDKNVTSHFFTSDATNNFCLEKRDAVVSFYVIGLSEKTNTDET